MRLISEIFIIISIFIQTSLQQILFEGESCTNSDGSRGVCKKSRECTTIASAIKQGKRPKVCSFDDYQPILCCPLESHSRPPPNYNNQNPNKQYTAAVAKAKQKCEEYAKSVLVEIESPVLTTDGDTETIDRCALVEETLILGGEKAKPREYPHMALIGYGSSRSIQWLCGGSLISERFVISAAHCSNPFRKGPARWVKLGELDTSSDDDDAEPQVLKIVKIIDHPKYNSKGTLYYDLTLFQLDREVFFDGYIRPICLTTTPHVTTHTAIATGWGHTQWVGQSSDSLLKVRLTLVNEKKCHDMFKNSTGNKLPQGIIESQLCAGDQKGKDTCQGDSGGPLQNPLKSPYCMYELLGVTSFGKGCGLGYPGVYTKISHYLPWIVEKVWP